LTLSSVHKGERRCGLCRLLYRDQCRELIVLLHLLLDLRELHELLGKLVGAERVEWVLVLQLRSEELQERVEIPGNGFLVDGVADRRGCAGRGGAGRGGRDRRGMAGRAAVMAIAGSVSAVLVPG
jgi:hypothetical protein